MIFDMQVLRRDPEELVNTSSAIDRPTQPAASDQKLKVPKAKIQDAKNDQSILKKLSVRLIDAQEKERRRISRELHDAIGGKLTGMKYLVEKALAETPDNLPDTHNDLKNLHEIIKRTLEESQRISKNLHPSTLDDLGLMPAIKDFVHEFRLIYPNIETECKLNVVEEEIEDQLKLSIYRTMQEAFTNVGKHSQCDRISLVLEKIDDQIHLVVSDDGIGFDIDEIAGNMQANDGGGLGLKNMQERVGLLDGDCEIKSMVGKGTQVRTVWPLDCSLSVDKGELVKAPPISGEKSIKIVIAEGQLLFGQAVNAIFEDESDLEVVGMSDDGFKTVQVIRENSPDVIVLGLTLQGGFSLIKKIRKQFPEIKIVVVTIHSSEEYIREAFNNGANGYCLRDDNEEDLLYAIRNVMRGRLFLSPKISEKFFAGS